MLYDALGKPIETDEQKAQKEAVKDLDFAEAQVWKPTKLAYQQAFDKGKAQKLTGATTCPACGRSTYFPIDSVICYDCSYVPDKHGRNKPCPCGSGKKYKKCCWQAPEEKKRPVEDDTPRIIIP